MPLLIARDFHRQNFRSMSSSVLTHVGRAYILEHDENTSPDKLDLLESALIDYLDGKATLSHTSQLFRNTLGTSKPFDRISRIVQTSDQPIPDFSEFISSQNPSNRKRTRSWTEYENQRLLAGIHRYGTDDWLRVANFVGNGRTRAQCSQRWVRGLDPRISRGRWGKEDEERLCHLVDIYGTKSWTKIAVELGNRSDVQCRYHYNQMQQGGHSEGIMVSTSMPGGLLINRGQQDGTKAALPSIHELLNNDRTWKNSVSMGSLPTFRPHPPL
jgi:hypothetical protein